MLSSSIAVPILWYTLNPPDRIQNAITNAINYLDEIREPHGLIMLDVLYRRFGIEEFADALNLYDQEIALRPEEAPVLRVLRRIGDYDNQLQPGDLGEVQAETDLYTVPALYCDRTPLTWNYQSILYNAASQGHYMLTHVLLACIWIQENGCEVPLPEYDINNVYIATARLIYNDSVVTDLELEAAAFLYLAGQGSLVSDTFIEQVIAVQNYDGGWLQSSDRPDTSYWHASILGLMLLLHVQNPADSYPPMLAPPSH